ncbi:MAG: hypothetical protein ACLVJH_17350 [Faecalibacterium prausnitzii]
MTARMPPQIKAIANWIDTHCAEGEIGYMIPHDMLYCPDHFQNCQLPATPINDKLASRLLGAGHPQLPHAVLRGQVCPYRRPLPQTFVGNGEMSDKLNESFLCGAGRVLCAGGHL